MTLEEASGRFHIDMETLNFCKDRGLLQGIKTKGGGTDYPETELCRILPLLFLLKVGMDLDTLKRLIALMNANGSTEADQVQILRKCRYQLLEDIHGKQQSLDQVDFLIHEIKEGKHKGG